MTRAASLRPKAGPSFPAEVLSPSDSGAFFAWHSHPLLFPFVASADRPGEVVGDLRLNDEPVLAEVFGCIEERYRDPVSLKDVARAVSLTPGHLTTVVRRKTGTHGAGVDRRAPPCGGAAPPGRDRPGGGRGRAQSWLQRSWLLREDLQARPRYDAAGLAACRSPVKGSPNVPAGTPWADSRKPSDDGYQLGCGKARLDALPHVLPQPHLDVRFLSKRGGEAKLRDALRLGS